MKVLILLTLLGFLGSCASNDLRKFGSEKYFTIKEIHLKGEVQTHTEYGRIAYAISKDVHCFETSDDREVYTVNMSNLNEAINHFYFRVASYDVKKVVKGGNEILIATAKSDARINLEIAHCWVVHSNHWIRDIFFLGNVRGEYASFRLAKD